MTEDKDVAYLPIVYEVSDPKNTPEKTLNIYNDWASTYDQVGKLCHCGDLCSEPNTKFSIRCLGVQYTIAGK